jgi:hypothetical protein
MNGKNPSLAAAITKAGSKQSYYTIKTLVDRQRVEDAFRAYGYFRWVDDTLDAGPAAPSADETRERLAFLERQKALLEACLAGETPAQTDPQEQMLVELLRGEHEKNSGLRLYVTNLMKVMDFDVRRRGRLVSQAELNAYTRWLAVAVTEALAYFLGHGEYTPQDETRYQAVSAAHIVHMLRDTVDDLQCGYYNIPDEVLAASRTGPQEINSPAYRAWVQSRCERARQDFSAGHAYFHRVHNLRQRLAGCAYMARFEWLLETIEQEGYLLRPDYHERKSLRSGLQMGWSALAALLAPRLSGKRLQPADSQHESKP